MLVSLVVPFKFNTLKLQCLNTLNDKTHAFLSICREHVAESAKQIVDVEDEELVRKHMVFYNVCGASGS